MLTLHLMSFPTHRSSSLSSLLLDAKTTLCLLRRSRVIVRPRYRRCDWMLPVLSVYFVISGGIVRRRSCCPRCCLDATLLSVYFVVPEAWFLVVIVVAAVVGGYPTLCTPLRRSIAHPSPRHFSSLGSRIPHHLSRQCREITHCHCHLRLLIFACHHQ